MKKLLIVMSAAFAAVMPLMADMEEVGGYWWYYTVNGDTAIICLQGGNGGTTAISPKPTGAVTIPSTLGGKPVTRIASNAFKDCSGLTSVTIPASVTNIGTIGGTVLFGAFGGCSGLRDVTVPQCVLDQQIKNAFIDIYLSLTNVSYSSVVTNIGAAAFYGCSGLTSVTIPDSVTRIGNNAFYGCTKLTSVTIPDSVKSIGKGAFYGCTNLTSVTIPDSVTRIENNAFYNCNASLYDTNSIPGVNLVDGWAIGNVGSLSGSLDLTGARGVGEMTFCNCSGLTNVVIGSGVTSIGESAFSGCSGLTNVVIGSGVTSIGESAFSGCSGLTSVTIPDSVTSLSTTAFDGCGKLWTAWYRTLVNASASDGISPSVVTTVVQQVESPYALTNAAADRAIASVTVDGDCAIDEFVLKDGKVYDSMLYVSNTADREVTLFLPTGYAYKTFKGSKPLAIPAKSQCMISITRVADETFLVAREDLEDVK